MLWADRERQHRLPAARAGSRCARAARPTCRKPGWTGEFEWDGTIPYDELPRVVNPARGFLVTANNRIVDDDYPHHITSEWMTGYRAQRIEEMLGERERHSVEDFERMQHDFFSLPGHRDRPPALAPAPAAASARRARSSGSRAGTAGSTPDTIAGTIYHAFTVVFAQAIVRAAVARSGAAWSAT